MVSASSNRSRSRPQLWLSGAVVWALLVALMLFALAHPVQGKAVVPTSVPTFDQRNIDKHYAGQRRQSLESSSSSSSSQDDGDGYNTSMSILPTSATEIHGQPSPTTSNSPHDPLLAIMPDFAFSMPAQVVVDGVNLALTTMLTIQLIFTMQYHFPLSKKNYILQSFSTLMLLISLAVHLHTVLSTLEHQVHGWPYMFAYIAVQIPPQDGSWSLVQEAFYLLMRAISTLSIHLTHIQFLTLLFPSALEARLILWMLGPLALVASGMEFTALSSDDDVKTSDLGDAIRNICNSTLFLLYTSGLLIWGLLVNRRRAWRTDGGTAAFGGGSVGLAFINTMVSFVEIAFDRLWWLPDILWTLTLWQSWLGFWWWVGSGMGIGEVEDRAERQERRRKREEKLRRKRERMEKQQRKAETAAAHVGSTGGSQVAAVAASVENGSDAIIDGIRRIKTALKGGENGTLNRRTRTINTDSGTGEGDEVRLPTADNNEGEQPLRSIAIDTGEHGHGQGADRRAQNSDADEVQTAAGSGSQSSDTHPTTSGAATSNSGWFGQIGDYLAAHQPDFIRRRMRRLRLAHVAAARRAATEQTVLRDQVLNRQSEVMGPGLRTMMFDNNRQQSPVSPAAGTSSRERERNNHASNLTAEPTFGSTDSTAIGSGRRTTLAAYVDDDQAANAATNTENLRSPRSMSVLPDHISNSPSLSGEGRQRPRSTHTVNRTQIGAGTSSRNLRGANSLDAVAAEDDWVDDEGAEEHAQSRMPQSGHKDATSRHRENDEDEDAIEETSSNVANDGDGADVNHGRDRDGGGGGGSSSSWTWRGGLRGLRMRDHTTYD